MHRARQNAAVQQTGSDLSRGAREEAVSLRLNIMKYRIFLFNP